MYPQTLAERLLEAKIPFVRKRGANHTWVAERMSVEDALEIMQKETETRLEQKIPDEEARQARLKIEFEADELSDKLHEEQSLDKAEGLPIQPKNIIDLILLNKRHPDLLTPGQHGLVNDFTTKADHEIFTHTESSPTQIEDVLNILRSFRSATVDEEGMDHARMGLNALSTVINDLQRFPRHALMANIFERGKQSWSSLAFASASDTKSFDEVYNIANVLSEQLGLGQPISLPPSQQSWPDH